MPRFREPFEVDDPAAVLVEADRLGERVGGDEADVAGAFFEGRLAGGADEVERFERGQGGGGVGDARARDFAERVDADVLAEDASGS